MQAKDDAGPLRLDAGRQAQLLTDSIRDAIRESVMSQSELSRRSGVGPSALSRFMGNVGGLSLDSLNRIVAALGIVLVPVETWRQREAIWEAYEAGRLRQVIPPQQQQRRA